MEIKMPKLSENTLVGKVHKVFYANGDYVHLDEVLVEVETDKATVEIVAEYEGIITVLVTPGSTIRAGDTLARIEKGQETIR